MRRPLLLAAAFALTLCTGCNESAPPSPHAGTTPATQPADGNDQLPSDEDVDKAIGDILILPYAGSTAVEEGLEEDGVVTYDRARAWPGYTLYIMYDRCEAEIIDMDGKVVHAWRQPEAQVWSIAELLPDGDIIVVGADHSDVPPPRIKDDARFIERLNWKGDLVWKRQVPAHHDVDASRPEQLMTLTLERRLVPQVHPTIPVRDDHITALNAEGAVIDSASLLDLVRTRPKLFRLVRMRPDANAAEPKVDLFHANSVEWVVCPARQGTDPIYDPGNVIVCMRHQSRVVIVNWERKELLWAWGLRELSNPHDARVLPNGHVLVFDNGLLHHRSRAVEMDPLTREIVWQYQAPEPSDFYSPTKGSCQRLPNGNTLIANGDSGQVFEVTPPGEVVWEFRCPYRNEKDERPTIYRAERYAIRLIERLRAAAGDEDK